MLYFSNLYWISAAIYLFISIFDGGARLICREFDPNTILKIIEKYRVTYLFLSPYLVAQTIKFNECSNSDTSKLKSMVVGGGKIIKEHLEALGKLFPSTIICYNYGMTENHGIVLALNPVDDAERIKEKPTYVGRPTPGHIYKVNTAFFFT